MLKRITLFQILSALLILSSCSHPPKNSNLDSNWKAPTKSEYIKALRKTTKKHQEYKGLNQIFEARITFLHENFQRMQLRLKANYINWSQVEAQSKLNELKESMDKEASFILSFFTPDPRLNKVDKNFADWTALLVTENGEIKGNVSLHENDSDHVKIFYPTLDVWSRVYKVTFPVSTKELQAKNFSFKLIGPLGMGVVDFKPL